MRSGLQLLTGSSVCWWQQQDLKKQHENQGRVKLGVRKASLPENSQALEQAAQGSGCGTKLPEFQERLDNALSLISGCSCVEPGVGLNGPYGSLLTEDILWFWSREIRCSYLFGYSRKFHYMQCFIICISMLIDIYNHASFAFSTKEWLKQASQFALSEWNIAWLHPHGRKE